MQFDWWTLALQTVNFAILVWLLHHFLYTPVLRMIDARRTEVEKDYADAEAAKAQAKAEFSAIESSRAAIAVERSSALEAAATQAEEMAAARQDRAEREASAILQQARDTLSVERDEAIAEARRASLDFGLDIARRLLDEVPEGLRAEAWLERAEEHLASLSPAQREDIAKGLNGSHALRVMTATPMPDAVTQEWQKRLDRALGDRTKITFDVDATLVAGVELHFPNAILCFSWRSTLEALRDEIEAHETTR